MTIDLRGDTRTPELCASSAFASDRNGMTEAPGEMNAYTRMLDRNYITMSGCTFTLRQPHWRTYPLKFCPETGYAALAVSTVLLDVLTS